MNKTTIQCNTSDYKVIFLDLAQKLTDRLLLNEEERIKLVGIINKDNQ
jgi:hypothetical protein